MKTDSLFTLNSLQQKSKNFLFLL